MVEKQCEQCGKLFEKKPYDSKKYWLRKRFCSQKCAGDSWRGSPAPKSAFKKGHISWNKGKSWDEKTRKRISEVQIGKKASEITKKKMSESHKGDKSYNWKGGISKTRAYNSIYKKRHRARKRNAEGSHTLGEWETLKIQYGFICPCCKLQEPIIKLTEDHIIPLSKGGSDYIENIQPLCQRCNSIKNTKIINFVQQ